jgi:hypothetical protein
MVEHIQNLPIMAMKITEKSWPVACAIFPFGFQQNFPIEDVLNCYMVINQPRLKVNKSTGEAKVIPTKSWMSPDRFHTMYVFMESETDLPNQFIEVRPTGVYFD